MNDFAFSPVDCPICEEYGDITVKVKNNFDSSSVNERVFSARRLPDRRTFRWVRCEKCGLLRSDPVINLKLADLYGDSIFTYDSEVQSLRKTYRRIVNAAVNGSNTGKRLLEIGGGNGFFLEEALEMGFAEVAGLEPSENAIASARQDLQNKIKRGMLEDTELPKNYYDLVAMFHVLDHLEDPVGSLSKLKECIADGGGLVVAVHDAKAWSAKVMGSRSPIYDVEHRFLFEKKTAIAVFEKAGFQSIKVSNYANHYSLAYVLSLLPIRQGIKIQLLNSILGRWMKSGRVWLPLGNMWIYGRKSVA